MLKAGKSNKLTLYTCARLYDIKNSQKLAKNAYKT